MYKAVFIDIDGTLIRKDHSISDATKKTIETLLNKKILIVLVSARPLHGITSIANEIGLQDAPIASLNGAYIAQKDDILFQASLEIDTTVLLQQQLSANSTSVIYYQQMQWFAEVESQYTINEQKITTVPVQIKSFDEIVMGWKNNKTGPNKILAVAEADIIQTIENKLKLYYAGSINMYTSKPIYLEFMNKRASKLKAVQFLMKQYNLLQEEIIAIGDNFNDAEMIAFAGLGIAMGNAPDAVKAVANAVTDTNNNDGVSKALTNIFNL